jgi:hypothetical protein
MKKNGVSKAHTFWEAKDYLNAVKVGLATVVPSRYKSSTHFAEVFLNLAYALYSASQVNLFNEFKSIFSKYMTIVASRDGVEPPIGFHNHAVLMQANLCATVFQYYENLCSIDEIKEAEALVLKFSAQAPNPLLFEEYNAKLLRLAGLIVADTHAYFTVSFKLPFALPIPDGRYEVRHLSGDRMIAVEGFSTEDVSSRVDDRHFSRVEITIRGFTCTDNYWIGPDIKNDHQEPRNSRLALSVVNRVVLEAKLVDESLRIVMATQRDIGNVVTKQYDGAGNVFHLSMGMTFGGFALVDVLSRQELDGEQCQRLSARLSVEALATYECLYAQSIIQRSAENMVGAYYLLNSAAEAMIDAFLFSLCEKVKVSDELERFLLGESICATCEVLKASPNADNPPRSANPPSPFQRLKFLQEMGIAESPKVRHLQKLLATIRNEDMRNGLSHGRKSSIPSAVVDKAMAAFRELRSVFQALEQANGS